MTEYEIQTRQKGAWLRWIGTKDRATMDKHMDIWDGRCAVRLVETKDGKVRKILATKPRVPHSKHR
jgi:hypothetical protein